MKKLMMTCACAVLLSTALDGCLPKKSAKDDAELQEMIDKAAEKKVAELEKQREIQEKLDRAEAIIAADEAKKAQAKKKPAQTSTVVVDVPGTRFAHVIREGGYTNARSGPGTGYAILNKVKDGSPILYSGRLVRNNWVQVYDTRGNYLGYMSANKIVP